jgi:MMP 1-O-methyltransferase
MRETARPELRERLNQLAGLIEPIQGWIAPEAGSELYRRARFEAPTPTVVEIGSWKGRSTAWLGFGLLDRGEGCVYAVDTWKGSGERVHQQMLADYAAGQLLEEFLQNMRGLGLAAHVCAMQGDSVAVARKWAPDTPIGLLFIDGDHDYEAVRADFEFWSPLVAPDGFIVFDDVPRWPGPLQVTCELPRWFRPAGLSTNQAAFQKMR